LWFNIGGYKNRKLFPIGTNLYTLGLPKDRLLAWHGVCNNNKHNHHGKEQAMEELKRILEEMNKSLENWKQYYGRGLLNNLT
jgi:hypothetical protein